MPIIKVKRWRPSKGFKILLVSIFLGGSALWWVYIRPERHKHCIKAASFILYEYAERHGGAYPRSERGWGDAMLALGSGAPDTSWVSY